MKSTIRILVLATFLSVMFVCFAFADTINIPSDYGTIQAAINAAVNGDTVLVATGTYYEIESSRGTIKINEILYDPAGGDTGKEWIELYNAGTESVQLEGWQIQKAGTNFEECFTFPEYSIYPGEYLLIGESMVPNADLIGVLAFQNGGTATDGVRIISAEGDTIDTILYDSPNTNNLPDDAYDPGIYFAVDVYSGHTLIRYPNGHDTDNCEEDFFDCEYPTPGYSNTANIQGTVTLSGGNGNIENVNVTAGVVSVNPDSYGDYDITISPGTYDVTASLEGYIDSTIVNVEVYAGQVTTDIDFILVFEQINIVINEIMQNPSAVGDSYGEWFEIVNIGNNAVNLIGWTIKDNGSDFHIISSPIQIDVGQYIVLGNNSDYQTNGGVNIDYEYLGITLGNGDDELILVSPNGTTIDSVAWDNGVTFPDPNGASIALLDPELDNSIGSNWTVSTTPFSDGDLGTPGLPNFGGEIEVSTNEIIFNTTLVGNFSSEMLTIYNNGLGTLIIDSIYTSSYIFQPSLTSGTIDPDDSLIVEITFTPDNYGWFNDILTIISDDYDNPVVNVNLSGFGIEPVPHIEVSSNTLNFPDVMIGLNYTLNLEIFNTGDAVLIVDSIYSNYSVFAPAHSEVTIPAGESYILPVTFTPTSVQYYSGLLTIESNDPDANIVTINLTGNGIETNPDIYVYPDTLNFGTVAVGDTAQLNLTIKNIGLQDLEVEEVYFELGANSPFWTDFEDATIEPGDSVIVLLNYCHQRISYEDTMYISSNDPDEELFDVSLFAHTTVLIKVPEDYPTIQEAINSSGDGDTVLVYPGTYVENINFNGKNITVGSLFLTTQDTSYISQTVIDGNQNGSVASFDSGEGYTTKLVGFKIINGSGNYMDWGWWTGWFGGGILCYNSSPNLEFVIISNNSINYDGAGGGICFYNSNACLANITISDNSGLYSGGAIYSYNSNPSLVNCILWNNSPDGIDGSATVTYSDIQGGWTGEGNIDTDPLFVDPLIGDFHLSWTNFPIQDSTKSLCIDAGDPSSPLDPDGTIADMGAYYFDQTQVAVNEPEEISTNMLTNYPNPINSNINNLTVSFNILKPCKVKIQLFNLKGQLVTTLLNEDKNIGEYSISHPINEYSSGIYFTKMSIDGVDKEIKKMILLR